MPVNLWFNVRCAKSGSMACAWVISPRTKSTTKTTTASFANPKCTKSSSSEFSPLPKLTQNLMRCRRLAKRPRQSSASSHKEPSTNPRVSRSHSPSYLLKQPSKRRNTMNSRDAAFDESLKEIIEATAAEAAAVDGVPPEVTLTPPEINDNKKKRKRGEEEMCVLLC